MKIDPAQSGFEFLPFLRSPGGCLVTAFCLLIGGCFGGLVWMKGFNSFTFDCGQGRTIVVYQARDKEFDQYTTYDFQICVYDSDQLKAHVLTGGTEEMVDEMHARTAADGNVVGVLWPGSVNEYVFIHDFRDNSKRSNLAEYYDDPQFNERTRLLNNNPEKLVLRAR